MISVEKWSAPGSLLVAGEYLVTEEGGGGICLAAGGRATMEKEPSTLTELHSVYAGKSRSWRPDGPAKNSLCYFVWEEGGNSNSRLEKGQRITVNTSALYSFDGQKLGLGSSAVAALLFSRAISHVPDNLSIARSALLAHRKWQKGHGSGYDVLSSASGGACCFTGGLSPSWESLGWPNLKYWLLRGPASMSSVQALRRYEAWKKKLGRHWFDIPLLADYHTCVLETISILSLKPGAANRGAFLEKLHELAALGSELGSAINQESTPLMPAGFSKSKKPWHRPGIAAAKSLGAGNEIVLLAGLEDGFTRSEELALEALHRAGRAFPLSIEIRGLSREFPG